MVQRAEETIRTAHMRDGTALRANCCLSMPLASNQQHPSSLLLHRGQSVMQRAPLNCSLVLPTEDAWRSGEYPKKCQP